MPNAVVVGTQWGDEGKGKVVDIFAEFADIIVRYQGGGNAGHTLVVNDEKTILHLVPSGIMHKGKVCVIGNGVVVDPEALLTEIDRLKSKGMFGDPGQLRLSYDAHIIMPYHKQLDRLREDRRGKQKIGTTGRGIGPAYECKAARRGFKARDLLNETLLQSRLGDVLDFINFQLVNYFGDSALSHKELMEQLLAWGEKLEPYMEETSIFLNSKLKQGRSILFEGAQGTMLDIDHGTYPYVTSSTTLAAAASSGAGVGLKAIDHIIGICKSYTTRVGMGPFPTEQEGDIGERLRQRGVEYGSTTGRPRRCGWLDIVVLRNAIRLNGLTELAITKLDVLTGFDRISICTGYKTKGRVYDEVSASMLDMKVFEPVYEDMPGWGEEIGDVRDFEELPRAAVKYLQRIEDLTGVKVCLVSIGPRRGETIILSNPFRK